ncbi:PEP-utilizing enzyme [Bacteroidota bacterium]
MEAYRRTFVRDFSLANIEIWYRAEAYNNKQWTDKKVPFQPHIVFQRKDDGLVTVYYSEDGLNWVFEELSNKLKEKGFLDFLERNLFKREKLIREIYEEEKTLNKEELIKFLDNFEDLYPWMEAMWLLTTFDNVNLAKKSFNQLRRMREKTNPLTPNTEQVIRKSIANIFPGYEDFIDVISGEEIRSGKLPGREILEERKKGYFFTDRKIFLEKTKEFIENAYAIKLLDYEKNEEGIVKGTIAHKGKVTGKAKIVMGLRDVSKVKKGDIIIASMTMTDVMPAIEKASAIVTDEGGTLCHAAIVAREMKKPCVIGTKIATRVFKDGDYIEVDANKGIVRKLSS